MMATLKGKIGPVPVWLAVLLVTLAAVWYLRRQASASSANTSGSNANTASGNLVTSGLDTPQLGTYGNTYITTYADGDTTDPGNTNPTTPAAGPPVAGTGSAAPPPPPAKGQNPPGKTKSLTYRVQAGDNLTKIANREGVSLGALEATNKSVITNDARAHGYTGANVDSHIYTGEQLVIP